MNLLVIGGSGYVGSLVLPILKQQHVLRVFDLRPPADASLEYIQGDLNAPETLLRAAEGCEALLYMAMGSYWPDRLEGISAAFDVNVKGVYLALHAAHNAGIARAVYTSSMSIYEEDLLKRRFPDEDLPSDSTHVYGFTKHLGEECCRVAARKWGMSVVALRLCHPTPEDKWLAKTKAGVPTIATTAGDVVRALLAALDYRASGFEAFTISGDYEQKIMDMSRAKNRLGWLPLARPNP